METLLLLGIVCVCVSGYVVECWHKRWVSVSHGNIRRNKTTVSSWEGSKTRFCQSLPVFGSVDDCSKKALVCTYVYTDI